jgi:hypothetical protein
MRSDGDHDAALEDAEIVFSVGLIVGLFLPWFRVTLTTFCCAPPFVPLVVTRSGIATGSPWTVAAIPLALITCLSAIRTPWWRDHRVSELLPVFGVITGVVTLLGVWKGWMLNHGNSSPWDGVSGFYLPQFGLWLSLASAAALIATSCLALSRKEGVSLGSGSAQATEEDVQESRSST